MPVTRIAIAGTRGHYAATLAELSALPQLRVVAFHGASDPVEPLADWCAGHGHSPKVFGAYEQMLEEARPDVVVVCGPFERHAPMCVAAVERGVHVLTEKPAALTFDQLAALRHACRSRPDVHVAAMMFSRYSPGFFTARRLIQEGTIGRVRLINTRKSYKLGIRPDYYRDRSTFGGTIPWVGSHAVDWILHLTDDAPFETVVAAQSSADNGGNGSMDVSASCLFTMAGGMIATASIDYLRPAAAPTHGDDWTRVVGTTGVIEVRPDSLTLVTERGGPTDVPVASPMTLLEDFVNHVDRGTPALLTTESTLALTEACLRALQSADEGRVVRFDQ